MLHRKYLDGYRKTVNRLPCDQHVVDDAVRRFTSGNWHVYTRDDGPWLRGYGAGWIALLVGVDLSHGRA
jgi:hypothetical protein